MSRPLAFADLSDPRVAAELEELRRGAAALDTLLAEAARRAREHAAALAEFERNFTPQPTPDPVVSLMVVVDVIPNLDLDFLDTPDEPVRH